MHAHVFICSASLWLLVGAFNPFTFKVIIDTSDPIIVFLIWWGLISVDRYFPSLALPAQKSSFSICCKAGVVVLNSLNFYFSGKLLISPSNLNESLAGQSIPGCSFFSFITLNVSCLSLLQCFLHREVTLVFVVKLVLWC